MNDDRCADCQVGQGRECKCGTSDTWIVIEMLLWPAIVVALVGLAVTVWKVWA